MYRQGSSIVTGLLAGLMFVAGCGDEGDDEFAGPELPDLSPTGPTSESSEEPLSESNLTSIDTTPTYEEPTELTEGNLRFSLDVGDHFPLQKTIEQKLIQPTETGQIESSSRLTLMFAITVEAEDEGRRKLAVRYQRVRYSQDILGDRIVYDSQSPPAQVPDALQIYHGLANNGFSFWLGAANRIIEVEDFDSFLKRCVRHAPPARQPQLLEHIVATQEDEGFANFVDDSIGLLPYNPQATGRETAISVNQSWPKSRRITRPLPMEIKTTYTLSELTDSVAKVSIVGSIEPIQTAQLNPIQQTTGESKLSLQSGIQTGLCIIDRKTGLPLRSRVQRDLKMNVTVGGGRTFEQYKTIVTMIESFPAHRTTVSGSPIGPRIPAQNIIRTDGDNTGGNRISNADFETQAKPSSTETQTPATAAPLPADF